MNFITQKGIEHLKMHGNVPHVGSLKRNFDFP